MPPSHTSAPLEQTCHCAVALRNTSSLLMMPPHPHPHPTPSHPHTHTATYHISNWLPLPPLVFNYASWVSAPRALTSAHPPIHSTHIRSPTDTLISHPLTHRRTHLDTLVSHPLTHRHLSHIRSPTDTFISHPLIHRHTHLTSAHPTTLISHPFTNRRTHLTSAHPPTLISHPLTHRHSRVHLPGTALLGPTNGALDDKSTA
jgi:hypothetical protein